MTTATATSVDAVRAGFDSVTDGDMAGFAAVSPDETWNHRLVFKTTVRGSAEPSVLVSDR